jgi:hypothetical protein
MDPQVSVGDMSDTRLFDELLSEVVGASSRFGHRQHVHLTWLAVRRCGMPDAIELVSSGIQRTARYAGAPQKYHATVSRVWVEAVAFHVEETGEDDFDAFVAHHPALLDKRLLTRWYEPSTLVRAKDTWVEPDRAPFPWAA